MSAWTRERRGALQRPRLGRSVLLDRRADTRGRPEGREGGRWTAGADRPDPPPWRCRPDPAALRRDPPGPRRQLNAAFNNARREYDYRAPYRGVFPIKVNQESTWSRPAVEGGLRDGPEVGSKPELIAGIAIQPVRNALICNGYKGAEYVEMALLASHLGITAVVVIEKLTELDTVLEASRRLGIRRSSACGRSSP